MAELAARETNGWSFPLTEVSQDSRGFRALVQHPALVKQSGVDCSIAGGRRPYYGYHRLTTIILPSWAPASIEYTQFEPFQCQTQDGSQIVWGFIFGFRNSALASKAYSIGINYRVDGDDTWYADTIPDDTSADAASVPEFQGDVRPLSARGAGRYLYLTVKGWASYRLAFTAPVGSAPPALAVKGGSGDFKFGPGTQPPLKLAETNSYPELIFDQIIASLTLDPNLTATSADTVDVDRNVLDQQSVTLRRDFVGFMPIPTPGTTSTSDTTPAPSAVATLHLSGYCAVDYDTATLDDEYIPTSPTPTNLRLWGSTSASGDDIGIWATSAGVPELSSDKRKRHAKLYPGDYAFAFQLFNEESGLTAPLSEILDVTREKHFHSRYIAQYDLSSDRRDLAAYSEFPVFAYLEIVYDADLYDKVQMFRSTRTQQSGGTTTARILSLDAIHTLADFELVAQVDPASTSVGNWKRVLIPYILNDAVLATQSKFKSSELVFREQMPAAGALHFDEGVMYFGDLSEDHPSTARISRFYHSDISGSSPEMLNPEDEYVLTSPSEDILLWRSLGNSILGFSSSRQYLARLEGNVVRVDAGNHGYGVHGRWAAVDVGNDVYAVTPRGLKLIRPDGAIVDLNAFDAIIKERWRNQSTDYFKTASVVFDEPAGVIYVYQPEDGTALCLWLETQEVSVLEGLPFTLMRQGWAPFNFADERATRFDRRALWLDQRGRVWMPDYQRRYNTTGTLLQLEGTVGDLRWTVAGIAGNSLTFEGVAIMPADIDQYRIANLSATGSAWGTYYSPVLATGQFLQLPTGQAANFAGGDLVALEPIRTEIITGNLPFISEDGMQQVERFRARQVTSIGASFSRVSGAAANTEYARFQGAVYVGENAAPAASGFPADQDGDLTQPSIVQGTTSLRAKIGDDGNGVHGTEIYPSVRIMSSGLDYVMTDMKVSGTIKGRETANVR